MTRRDFELIPAIDLLGGRCVRLAQGRYDEATVYGDDPGAVAEGFVRHAIPRLHVVDLDGARSGRPANREALAAIVARAGDVPVQLGGGIRSRGAVEEALEAGAGRVVLGTAALRDPELVREAARAHPGAIAVGIDARGGRVAVHGWTEQSEAEATELARRFEDAGVAAIIYTEIERDGMLSGPDLEGTGRLARAVSIPVIASGGVASEDDVLGAAAVDEIAGVIVGRALYTGKVGLESTLRRLGCS